MSVKREPLHLTYNRIDRDWELLDGYEMEPMAYFDRKETAYSEAITVAKRSAGLLWIHNVWGRVIEKLDFS